MNLSLDAIRTFSGSQNIVLNAERQSVKAAGVGHSIASFFGTASAKETNRQTFDAIKQAVLSDERFFGVRDQARELLSKIDANKAINAGTIKNIVDQLDRLSTPRQQEQQLLARFEMHLMNRELPAGWEGQTKNLMLFINNAMRTMISEAGGVARVNVALELQKMCDLMQEIHTTFGDDPKIFEFAKNLFIRSSPENARQEVMALQPFLAELRKLNEENPGVNVVECGLRAMTWKNAISSVMESKVLKPGIATALHALAKQIDPGIVTRLMQGTKEEAVLDVHQFLNALNDVNQEMAKLQPDPYAQVNGCKFMMEIYMNSFSQEVREAVLEKLQDSSVKNLALYYTKVDGTPFPVYNTLLSVLQASLGLPNEIITSSNETCDYDQIPLELMREKPAQTMFLQSEGVKTNPVLKKRIRMLENLEDFNSKTRITADKVVRDYTQAQCTKWGKTNIALEMKKHMANGTSTFEKDLERNMQVTLPNGMRLPNTMEAARDAIVQYLSKNPQATYQNSEKEMQVKACLLMSLLSQETIKLADTVATIMPFDKGIATALATTMDEQEELRFKVIETADGGWRVSAASNRPVICVGFPPDGEVMCKEGSKIRARVEVTISGAEIDRLSRIDQNDFLIPETVDVNLHVDANIVYALIPR